MLAALGVACTAGRPALRLPCRPAVVGRSGCLVLLLGRIPRHGARHRPRRPHRHRHRAQRCSAARPARRLSFFNRAVIAASSIMLIIHGAEYVAKAIAASPALQMPMRYYFLAVPVGGALNLFFLAWPRAGPHARAGIWPSLAAGFALYLAIRYGAGYVYGESSSALRAQHRRPGADHSRRARRLRDGLRRLRGLRPVCADPAGHHFAEHGGVARIRSRCSPSRSSFSRRR